MPVVQARSILSGMQVQEAMRRQVIRLSVAASIQKGIITLIKYKSNAVLITDEDHRPQGVVSKTEIIGAYYAGLPEETPLGEVMMGPPLSCYPDDNLEYAIEMMQKRHIHQLYVLGAESEEVIGTLAYDDIVGLLYRYCRACDRSYLKPRHFAPDDASLRRLAVKEVMTPEVTAYGQADTLAQIIEGLSDHRFGAVLIRGDQNRPCGVISKADLILAYHHGVPIEAEARTVMSRPVRSCEQDDLLAAAIRLMLLKDIQRLFVHNHEPSQVVGILTLSDAARFRSGTCRACVSSRIIART